MANMELQVSYLIPKPGPWAEKALSLERNQLFRHTLPPDEETPDGVGLDCFVIKVLPCIAKE